MRFRLRTAGFGTTPDRDDFIATSIEELAWAVATVGRNLPASMGDQLALYEAVGLWFQTLAYVEVAPRGLVLSERFRALDMSEKAAFSYRLAMALAKLAAEDHLGAVQTLHVDPLVADGTITLLAGKSRPDLLCEDLTGAWHAVEAKGRAYSTGSSLMTRAKAQAARVSFVNGSPPSTTCGSVSRLGRKPFVVDFHDPEPRREHQKLEVDALKATAWLFAPIRGLRETTDGRIAKLPDGEKFQLWRLPSSRTEVGVAMDIAHAIGDPAASRVQTQESARRRQKRTFAKAVDQTELSISPAGIAITLRTRGFGGAAQG